MSIILKSGSSSDTANVDTNKNLLVNLPTAEAQAGFASIVSEKDGGDVTGSRLMVPVEASEDYRLRVGQDQTLFQLSFEGSTVAQGHIQQNLSTMTAAQTSGYLALNSGNATASTNAANVRTYRTFSLYAAYTVYVNMILREANETATNAVSEWGLGYVSGVAAPTDGVFFRRLAGGALRAVLAFASAETEVTITTTNVPGGDGTGSYSPTERNHYLIEYTHNICHFWINDVLVASIPSPSTQPGPTSGWAQPVFARVYNSGIASAGRRIELGAITVEQADMNSGKAWAEALAGGGGGSYQAQPGSTSGGTVSRAAATGGYPASGTAKTTTGWATGLTTPGSNELGGRWLSPAISTLTTEVDYPVFSYLNPAGSATLPGKTLYVKSIRVGETIALAAASTNGIMLVFAVGVGSTAASTATGDGAATVGPRIGVLGSCYFTAAAAIGQTAQGWEVTFDSPLVVPAGTYLHLIVRPVGTVASNTLVVTGSFLVNGYFE
jgi:hypothetical protein